jgi:hypothetical protein
MKLRTTLAVLVIGLLAWGVIKLMGEPPKSVAVRVPLVPEELVTGWKEIDLDLLSDQDLRLVREPGAVMLQFGSDANGNRLMYRDRADPDKVLQLLRALRDSFREPMRDGSGAELKDALLRAGLDPPRYHVAIRDGHDPKDGKTREVKLGFGNLDPTGQGILARCYDDGTMFRTSRDVTNLLDYNLRDWRDRTVFTLDPLAVTRIDVARFPREEGKETELITVERQGNQSWRITQPRSLAADTNACQSLAQQASLLRIEQFVGQQITKEIREATRLPEDPEWSLQITAQPAIQALEIGNNLSGQGYACRMTQRDENLVFAVNKDALDAILHVTVDSLRPKRLFPRIESLLVGLKCLAADGKTVRWFAEREGQNPRGAWLIKEPAAGKANEGKGAGSFGQVVVDVDRTEVVEFLPAETPFTPEATIALQWYVQRSPDPILATRALEVARDRDHHRTLVRDPQQPAELFAVGEKLGALLDLDLELYRDRAIFPKKEQFQPRLVHWRFEVPGDPSKTLEVVKKGAAPPEAVGSTPTAASPRLQSAPAELLGSLCAGYVRAATVLSDPSRPEPRDPFAKIAFQLTLGTPDGDRIVDETLTVQGSGPDAPEGLYCKLTPRLPDDVWMIVPRGVLEPLFRLAQ